MLADYPYYFIVARGNENLSSNFVPAKDWLYVWHQIMAYLNEFVPDEKYKKKLKVALLNRLLFGTRFHTFLLTSRTTKEQKTEWLHEAKAFVDAHMDNQLIAALNPKYHAFWQAVKADDIDQLLTLTVENKPAAQTSKPSRVIIKRANVVSYKRPSVNAIEATTYAKADRTLSVFPSIPGWFEIRRIETDGVQYAEFIQEKDVRFTIKSQGLLLLKHLKSGIKKSFKKVSKSSH